MISNFTLWELKWRFVDKDNEITNYGENFVVIVNRKQMKIAQIYRTSANRYEIIRAETRICRRTHESSFSEAEKVIKEFLKNAGKI